MGLERAQISISPEHYLMSLPAYDANHQVAELVEFAKIFYQTRDYFWRGVVVPASYVVIGGLATIEDQVQLEPGTYITSINGWSTEAEGFEFNIYDQDHNLSYIHGRFVKDFVTGRFDGTQPFGQGWIFSPLSVGSQLIVTITNLSASTARIQLLLSCAVPATTQSTAQPVVKRK